MRSEKGLVFLPRYINAFMSLKVERYIDFEARGMFVCTGTEARVLSSAGRMNYNYYWENVMPRPETEEKKGWICMICGYVYEGEELQKILFAALQARAADFEKIS